MRKAQDFARFAGVDDAAVEHEPRGAVLGAEIAREGIERLNLLSILERAVTPDPGTPYARDFGMPSLNSLVPMHLDLLGNVGAGCWGGDGVEVLLARGFVPVSSS